MSRKMKKSKNTSSVFNPKKMLLSEHSPFSVKEAYKTLRTNVVFSLPGSESKCIGIVSADRGDGKSSIAINLSASFAQINKKVIIIDCDMRLPTIASKTGIRPKPGLSNFLAGTEAISDNLIQRVNPLGVDVLVAGDIPPDPSTLLSSDMMNKLIDFLKQHYDYIILDFPPATIVSDAALLSRLVDGYLIVVRHNESEFQKINETLRQMNFAEAKILGFVYNAKNNDAKYYKRGKYSKYYYKNYYYKKN